MLSFCRDLRIAFRHLRKTPAFAGIAILMLALGIGATTAVFSLVEGVLLRPLPFPHSERLVAISDRLAGIEGADVAGGVGVTAQDIQNYTRDTHSFTGMGGYRTDSYELSGGGEPETVVASRLTSGVLPALGVQPMLGRFFTKSEDDGHAPVAVLSYALWKNRYAARTDVLGSKILLDRKPYTVIGVMPRSFEFPLVPGHLYQSRFWVPMSFTANELSAISDANWNFQMIARLKPGVTGAQAMGDTERVAQATMRNYPSFMAGLHMEPIVDTLHEATVQDGRPLIHVLFLAVLTVLLIACANLAGLLLVRALRQRREMAVRMALGASPITLVRQAIAESLLLSVSGGVLGIGLAAAALKAGVSQLPDSFPLISGIRLSWPVLGFALALALLTGVLCGLAPAFAAMRTSMNETLKEGGRTGTSGGTHTRLRSALVVSEIAVALVLLAASGLLLRSFEKMRAVDLGFRPDHAVVAVYSLPKKQYATQAAVDQFNQELLRRLSALPGVTGTGLTSMLPASGSNSNASFVAEGYQSKSNAPDLGTPILVQGDYFHAMGIPLLRGRLLDADDTAGKQLVVVVNRKLAEQSWPGQDPIGKRFRLGVLSLHTPWAMVVGEVENIKESSPDMPAKQQWYAPIDQEEAMVGEMAPPGTLFGNGGNIVLRTAVAPEQMENALRETVRSIDAQLPVTQLQTMDQAVSASEAPRRFDTTLISSFAGIALLLALLGIYSIIAFSVALRTQEIAIRMALGSPRAGVVRLILYSGAKLAAIGCAIGLGMAFATGHLLRTLLFNVGATDPLVLCVSALAILLLAIAASLLPAARAASIDPIQTLRAE